MNHPSVRSIYGSQSSSLSRHSQMIFYTVLSRDLAPWLNLTSHASAPQQCPEPSKFRHIIPKTDWMREPEPCPIVPHQKGTGCMQNDEGGLGDLQLPERLYHHFMPPCTSKDPQRPPGFQRDHHEPSVVVVLCSRFRSSRHLSRSSPSSCMRFVKPNGRTPCLMISQPITISYYDQA